MQVQQVLVARANRKQCGSCAAITLMHSHHALSHKAKNQSSTQNVASAKSCPHATLGGWTSPIILISSLATECAWGTCETQRGRCKVTAHELMATTGKANCCS